MLAVKTLQPFETKVKNESPFQNIKSVALEKGPAERWRHGRCVVAPLGKNGTMVARAVESYLLDVLQERGQICRRMREAGLRFKRSYMRAGLGGRTGLAYSMVKVDYSPHSSELERTEAEEEAYQKWRMAMKAVKYPYNDMLVTALCHEVPLPKLLFPKFLEALKALAQHYEGPEVLKSDRKA